MGATCETGWRDIASAPKPRDWLGVSGEFLIARFWKPRDEDGEPDGPIELLWAHVAYLTADGWMCGTAGFAGTHGYASFRLSDATHWMPLPAPPHPLPEGER